MGFRDREKRRLVPLKPELFSAEAQKPGTYKGKRYDFCLRDDRARENLYAGIRDDALSYFGERSIRWHDGSKGAPSNHLCCSQSFCVNFWFAFCDGPEPLAALLRGLGYDAVQMLPFELDRIAGDDKSRYVSFEWIGARNYLRERAGGRVARDEERTRGQGFTSLDFAFRFRRSDGLIQIVAGEWKYTENYTNGNDIRISRNGTDRLDIYRPSLEAPGCQIALNGVSKEALFFDPFDQLMRQQLLCSAMECEGEMGADVVSLLHIVPAANREFLGRVTSPALRSVGADVHETWSRLVKQGRFAGIELEHALPLACRHAPEPEWAEYMRRRYGGIG